MNAIHDNRANKISEFNLLHYILNSYKVVKMTNLLLLLHPTHMYKFT